ncbi:MAG: hypothetical protein AAGF59_11965 [Pseudomonadota bacterium]
MGLFDTLTGSGQARAHRTVRDLAGRNQNANQATLAAGTGNARSTSVHGTNAAIHTLQGARDAAQNLTRQGGVRAEAEIDLGTRRAQGAFAEARRAYGAAGAAYDGLSDLSGRFDPAVGLYNDALGLNGREGRERARSAFDNSLQTTFDFDQGLEAINRARAARGAGTISGGNIDRDAQRFGQNLARSQSGAFLDRLSGLVDRRIGTEQAVAGGRAGAHSAIAGTHVAEAGLLERSGQSKAGIVTDTAARLAADTRNTSGAVAGLQTSLSDRLASLARTEATDAVGLRQDYERQVAQSILGERQARDQASAKLLGLGIDALGIGARVAGAIPGFFGGSGGGAVPRPSVRPTT